MNRSLFQTQGLQITEIVDTRLMQIDLPGAFLWMIEKKKKNKQTNKKTSKSSSLHKHVFQIPGPYPHIFN